MYVLYYLFTWACFIYRFRLKLVHDFEHCLLWDVTSCSLVVGISVSQELAASICTNNCLQVT